VLLLLGEKLLLLTSFFGRFFLFTSLLRGEFVFINKLQDFIHAANEWKPKVAVKKKIAKEHEVEEVVGKRTFEDGSVQFKIKWKEFDEDHCTWEPPSHLAHAPKAVAAYEEAHKME
jgi:hypothetical protein